MHTLDAETITHNKTNEELSRISSWIWDDDAMKQRLINGEEIQFADEPIRTEFNRLTDIKVTAADRTLKDEMVFDLGMSTFIISTQ